MARSTNTLILTPEIVRAAAWDAGNRSMRRAGRTKWSAEDWDIACAEIDRLAPHLSHRVIKGMPERNRRLPRAASP